MTNRGIEVMESDRFWLQMRAAPYLNSHRFARTEVGQRLHP